jgi:hypothetical protein
MATRFENVAVLVDSGSIASPVTELEREMQRMLRIQFKEFIYLLQEIPEQRLAGRLEKLVFGYDTFRVLDPATGDRSARDKEQTCLRRHRRHKMREQ